LCSLITRFPRLLETTIIEGRAAPQGLGLPSGQTQKYMNDL